MATLGSDPSDWMATLQGPAVAISDNRFEQRVIFEVPAFVATDDTTAHPFQFSQHFQYSTSEDLVSLVSARIALRCVEVDAKPTQDTQLNLTSVAMKVVPVLDKDAIELAAFQVLWSAYQDLKLAVDASFIASDDPDFLAASVAAKSAFQPTFIGKF